jgi:hypothetical protein
MIDKKKFEILTSDIGNTETMPPHCLTLNVTLQVNVKSQSTKSKIMSKHKYQMTKLNYYLYSLQDVFVI